MNIEVRHLFFTYNLDGPNAVKALQDISLSLPVGQSVGILGATGSGKSTLVQHLNGLFPPQTGGISFNDHEFTKSKNLPRNIRQKVGLVFQFAEFGFFEETVFDEVAFSPRQWGWEEDQVREETLRVLEAIGFPVEIAQHRSPFQLSGGQQRMVALASVMVMQPEVLILDEPTVGLDASTKDRISRIILTLKDGKRTLILISHDIDFVAPLVDRVVILKEGRIIGDGSTFDILTNQELLCQANLEPPAAIRYASRLQDFGIALSPTMIDLAAVRKALREIGRSA